LHVGENRSNAGTAQSFENCRRTFGINVASSEFDLRIPAISYYVWNVVPVSVMRLTNVKNNICQWHWAPASGSACSVILPITSSRFMSAFTSFAAFGSFAGSPDLLEYFHRL
jgi:hypothetical protein